MLPGELKSCIYCGNVNDEERTTCVACKNSLVQEIPEGDAFVPSACPPDVSSVELRCAYENGFAYPDWRAISRRVRSSYAEQDWHDVWQEISKRWVLELKENLGGAYRCYESDNFLLLDAEGSAVSRRLLSTAESSLETIQSNLGPLVNHQTYGKHVILAFSEPDDYYSYVSPFHRDGEHSLSAGIFLSRGYMHIAIPFKFVYSSGHVIAHELVHNCIHHLDVPTWIHEGMAQRLERLVVSKGFLLDREMAARHYAYWNAGRIQEFWAGASFYVPGDGNELSYNLSQILVEVLGGNWNEFLSFVREADPRDGGQDAALNIMRRCLGKTIEDFLGPGEWRPNRRIIASHFDASKKPKPDGQKE